MHAFYYTIQLGCADGLRDPHLENKYARSRRHFGRAPLRSMRSAPPTHNTHTNIPITKTHVRRAARTANARTSAQTHSSRSRSNINTRTAWRSMCTPLFMRPHKHTSYDVVYIQNVGHIVISNTKYNMPDDVRRARTLERIHNSTSYINTHSTVSPECSTRCVVS